MAQDLIQLITTHASEPSGEAELREAVAAHVRSLKAGGGRGDRQWVKRAEQAVRADPGSAFSFDDAGTATLLVHENRWSAGRFQIPPIAELRNRCKKGSRCSGQVQLWVLDGASPATDIGSLQATSSEGTLFQVASQFNCLEAPDPCIVPVTDYFHDYTQGPRASISAFPATLLRHYAAPAPDGSRFVQKTDGRQIDLLADVLGPDASDNGYFTGSGIDAEAAVEALTERFDDLRVGVHDAVQPVLGYDWDGGVPGSESRRIAQVFTSTVAGGMYGGRYLDRQTFHAFCRQLLRAAYFGTLLAAVSLARERVVLTLIGGGVFRNPVDLILDAIWWAADEVQPLLTEDLIVVLNGYNLGEAVDLASEVLPEVRTRRGTIVRLNGQGLAEILR